jgi:hypothetical protein
MNHKPLLMMTVGLFLLAIQAAAASQEKCTYLHRSRGADLRAVNMVVTATPAGETQYAIDEFIGSGIGNTVTLTTDKDGKPLTYISISASGFEARFTFTSTNAIYAQKTPDHGDTKNTWSIEPGARPDFNSRPDPYLMEHVLIRAYDFDKKGKQLLPVYDIDDTGKGISNYQISLELLDDGSVILPTGRFKARHLVQVQQDSVPTWFKKHRGSQTDVWVDEAGTILRIYRHREPYEVILQNYFNIPNRISETETAQGISQPACFAP